MPTFSSTKVVVLFILVQVLIAQEARNNNTKEGKNDTGNIAKLNATNSNNKKIVILEDKSENSSHNKAAVIKIDSPTKKSHTKTESSKKNKKSNSKHGVKKPKQKTHTKSPPKEHVGSDEEDIVTIPKERSTEAGGVTTKAPPQHAPGPSNLSIPSQSPSPTQTNQSPQPSLQQGQQAPQPSLQQGQQPLQHTQPNQQLQPQHMNQQQQQQPQQMNQQNGMGGNSAQCSQMMSQCNPPYNSMPQSGNCGLSCIPNVNDHLSNCMNMLASCSGGQNQYQTNSMTPPSMCNNLLGQCQSGSMNNANQNYMQQCAALMGQCAPQAFGSGCGSGMTPMPQSCSPILYGCQSSQKYNFMGDDTWTPPPSPNEVNAMLSSCVNYMKDSCSSSMSPSKIVNCQNLMDYCRNMDADTANQQTAQQCTNLLVNCFQGGSSGAAGGSPPPSSCVPALSQQQCQSYLFNCMPGQFGGASSSMAPSGGNAAGANIDQCIALMSQCYPLIQGPQIQGNMGQSAQKDCSALLQYCNCLNSNCNQQTEPIPSVSASDCAALMGTCNSAASHMSGIQGMPAGCAPYYMHCKRSCVAGCPSKCCGSTRSKMVKQPAN